jgi:hypothetical protein
MILTMPIVTVRAKTDTAMSKPAIATNATSSGESTLVNSRLLGIREEERYVIKKFKILLRNQTVQFALP